MFVRVVISARRIVGDLIRFRVDLETRDAEMIEFCDTDCYETAILMAEETSGAFGPVHDRVHTLAPAIPDLHFAQR